MFSCLLVASTSWTQFFLDNHITGLGMRGRGQGGGGGNRRSMLQGRGGGVTFIN